ncbi:MAG: hypothetical protein COZ18_02500 [Flexibacter sp. CG_4_10_14_3_um_filter_32_15]|nr:MAG: hypothetical protein COZ18_02500 [Flexibacter sp. CG_4_10_14_3_um_filter_32_15]
MTKITIELNNDLAQKIEYLVNSYANKNILFERFIGNYKKEIEEGINKMNATLKTYEEKYNMSSESFYYKFEKGEGEETDTTDFMIWAGVYEMKLKSENKLKKIS